jgi:hypothetical protein
MSEHQALEDGGARIKFDCTHVGAISLSPEGKTRLLGLKRDLARGLDALRETKAAPVGPDGKLLGNCACLLSDSDLDGVGQVLISRSGRGPNEPVDFDRDFPICVDFDEASWSAKFRSASPSDKPSSDSPLHWFSLVEASDRFHWETRPNVVLHGHSFASVEDAEMLKVPISKEDTLFSTKEDVAALMGLLKDYSYPEHKVFIRNGHGFLIFSQTMEEAIGILKKLIEKKKDEEEEQSSNQAM